MKIIKEYQMKTDLLSKHPIRIFCIANFLTVSLLVVSFSFDCIPQWAPGGFAIVIILFLKGKSGVYELIKSMSFKFINLKWYLLALIFPILLCYFSYIGISMVEYKEIVNLKLSHSLSDYGTLVFLIILGSCGEELGWRGFMLPQLLKKYSLFTSSLLIGIFWGIWHLNILLGMPVFIIYLILVIEFSFISSWLYIKTKRNLLTTIILHTSINVCSIVFFERIVISEKMNSQSMLSLYGTLTIFFFIPCIFIVKDMLINNIIKINK